MAYTGDFTTLPGNYGVGKQCLDEEVTRVMFVDTTKYPLGNGEYTKLFFVPAGTIITEVYVVCHTAEGAAETIDITLGDATTTTLVSNASMEVANVVTATNARIYVASDTYIAVKPDAAITAAKFFVIAKTLIASTSM